MKDEKINGIIICGYPGIGKSTAASNKMNIEDAESRAYSHDFDPDTCTETKNESFPGNYVDALEKLASKIGGYEYVLASCHKEVRDELDKRGLPYIVVMPHFNCKDEYLQRYIKRGDSAEFIGKMYWNWEKWHDEIDNSGCPVIHLWEGQNLSDILPN